MFETPRGGYQRIRAPDSNVPGSAQRVEAGSGSILIHYYTQNLKMNAGMTEVWESDPSPPSDVGLSEARAEEGTELLPTSRTVIGCEAGGPGAAGGATNPP